MLIAHISDTHVDAPGKLTFGKVDTRANFERALERISSQDPRPDFLLHTGDLIQDGAGVGVYRDVRAMLDNLRIPYAVIPGNHDDPPQMRAVFSDAPWSANEAFLHFTIEGLPVRLICLDTTIAGKIEGDMCPKRMAWLAEQLDRETGKPTMIAMHHPAFRIGKGNLPLVKFGSEEGFSALIGKHSNLHLIVAGHVHCTLQSRIGSAVALSIPSTAFQFAIQRSASMPFGIIDEPAGYYLHDWDGKSFTSQLILVGDYTSYMPPRPAQVQQGPR